MCDTWLSVVIPTLNEGNNLRSAGRFSPLQKAGVEIIVVDGGSSDQTINLAKQFANTVATSPKGRAQQMNAGAHKASGQWLLFLHADTQLSIQNVEALETSITQTQCDWGRFDVRLSGHRYPFRVIEQLMNWRSHFTRICTGDQAIFVRRTLFKKVGGYPDQPLMEDIELSRRLKQEGKFIALKSPVKSSSRYWETNGITKSVLKMWSLRLLYFFGANPKTLHDLYYPQ